MKNKSLLLQLYPEKRRSYSEESNCSDTENAFKNRMANIKKIKQNTHPVIPDSAYNILYTLNDKSVNNDFTFNIFNTDMWEFSNFYTEYLETTEKLPHLFSSTEWNNFNSFHNYSEEPIKTNGIELRNVIIKSKFPICYPYEGIEINISVNLKGEGSFWLFTRSLIEEVNHTTMYNKNSTVIEISKMKNCNKSFISFGTFLGKEVIDGSSLNSNYKSFFKRQLINYNSKKDSSFSLHDICEYKLNITDQGSEIIKVRILFNDSHKENVICANYYYPVDKEMYLMLAGGGDSARLTAMKGAKFQICKYIENTNAKYQERSNCNCCILY